MRKAIVILALALVGCAPPPINRTAAAPPPTQAIDVSRYSGLWHEAARLPNGFENGCMAATAVYGALPNGQISVTNTCVEESGHLRDVHGRARVVGTGKLKVSFFAPFWADYWVLARAEDYSWSIVGEPSGRYLWVLTRADHIDAAQRTAFEQRLTAIGYDVSKLHWNGA